MRALVLAIAEVVLLLAKRCGIGGHDPAIAELEYQLKYQDWTED